MASQRVLITGGEGFIGRHLARALLERGDHVISLDPMISQVHGDKRLSASDDVEFLKGDIRDRETIARAFALGVDAVVHLAADVGVGQSMYEIERYVSVNDLGTALLLEAIVRHPVRRLVVASSMSIYGEGLYRAGDSKLIEAAVRTKPGPGRWEPLGSDGAELEPVPTPEWKRPQLASVYAMTKYAQERLSLIVGGAYGIEAIALRLFNVYGPGQALSNPYTGVLAIFAQRLLNRERPIVFEDGLQRRDFVHVSDVVRALVGALDASNAAGQVFNIGSGESISILDIARELSQAMGREELVPHVLGRARTGDVRHCFADISAARSALGYVPSVPLSLGLEELAAWVQTQTAQDLVPEAARELEVRGLVA